MDAPVTDSLMGKGAFAGNRSSDIQECWECMEPRHPIYGVSECDLLIVVGARFSDRVTGNASKICKECKNSSD